MEQTDVYYEKSEMVVESEWKGIESLVMGDLLMRKSYSLYMNDEKELILQLREGGSYFLLSSPYLWVGCDCCDEETTSSFSIKEFADIYDLVWEFVDDENLFYDQIMPETYEELYEFPEEDLKERLLGW